MTDAAWPTAEDLAQIVDVDNVDDWRDTLESVVASAIAKVKKDVGSWDEDVDAPDDSLRMAALRMGELMSLRPNQTPRQLAHDPAYVSHLFGHRRQFGIA